MVQDLTTLFVATWYETLDATLLDFSKSVNRLTMIITMFSIAGLLVYVHYLEKEEDSCEAHRTWGKESILIGLVAAVLGLLPAWSVARQIYTNRLWVSRLGLASMFGAALLLVRIGEILIRKQQYRIVLLCILVGLGIGW